jgi:hypothetical protein
MPGHSTQFDLVLRQAWALPGCYRQVNQLKIVVTPPLHNAYPVAAKRRPKAVLGIYVALHDVFVIALVGGNVVEEWEVRR